jgi:hypothetical protein
MTHSKFFMSKMTMTNSWCLTGFKLSIGCARSFTCILSLDGHVVSVSQELENSFMNISWIYDCFQHSYIWEQTIQSQSANPASEEGKNTIVIPEVTKYVYFHITKISISFLALRKMEILFKAHRNFILQQVQHSTHWTQCFMNWQEGFYMNLFGERLRSNRMHATFESKFASSSSKPS